MNWLIKKSLFVFAILTFTVIGCSEDDSNPTSLTGETTILSIDIESHFENDDVFVILDDTLLLSDNITTNYTVSAAWSSGPLDCIKGGHHLVVGFTGNSLMAEHDFSISDTLSILVRYSVDNNQFSFIEYDGIVLRD